MSTMNKTAEAAAELFKKMNDGAEGREEFFKHVRGTDKLTQGVCDTVVGTIYIMDCDSLIITKDSDKGSFIVAPFNSETLSRKDYLYSL